MSLKNNKGFTLLEMLVVIMIMGFLLAMIAPRFAGIFGDSEDTVCDTNIKTTRQYLAGFEMANNKLPDDLINIVNQKSDGTYYGPCEEDPMADGLETFTTAILERLVLAKHVLTSDEAIELGGLGIHTVLNWNNEGDTGSGKMDIFNVATPSDGTGLEPFMAKTNVAGGMQVLMIGGGNQDGTPTDWHDVYQPGETYPYDIQVEGAQAGDFTWFNRIILGVGPDCELVTTGYAQAAGICPSYERGASDNTAWGYYCMVLPRLASTIEQIPAGKMATVTVVDAGEEAPANPQEMEIDLVEPGDRAGFDVFCPEGHRWPEVTDVWQISSITTKP
ncbi:MAG: type II secretion system protein [Deltaproteobacteria bacterium]|nr:type II secretion system protein [Deltaproteobacteria bacterium]